MLTRASLLALPIAATLASPVAATTEPVDAIEGEIVVFAAASLTDSFTEIGEAFENEHPDIDVTFNFAASSDLVTQITEGAPADVFAPADHKNMDRLADADAVADEPQTFATNSLAILVEPGNPEDISGVESLEDPGLIVVTCDPEVPIGGYTEQVFANAGVDVEADSYEENVKGIVTKVLEGEADAGVVYATDVIAAGDDADGIEIPADINVVAEYPIAVTAEAPNPDAAAAFETFVLGAEGQGILADYGFGPADAAEPGGETTDAAAATTAAADIAAAETTEG